MLLFARLQGYALAAMDTNTLSIVYPGVSKTARNQRVSSSLISKLKEGGTPIITDVRSNNTSSMVERFEHFGFVKGDVNVDRTKLRWENGPRLRGVKLTKRNVSKGPPIAANTTPMRHDGGDAIVEPIHPKAIPVILTTDEERDVWMRAP
jgi:hypothetical protein